VLLGKDTDKLQGELPRIRTMQLAGSIIASAILQNRSLQNLDSDAAITSIFQFRNCTGSKASGYAGGSPEY
jgi:hypothetical protein